METTLNKVKRESRFKKTFSYYLRHPQYDELKKLYINGSFNNIKSIKNQFEKNIKKNNKTPTQIIEKIKRATKKTKEKKKIIKEQDDSYNVQIDRNLNARLKVEILNIYTNEKTPFQTDQLNIIEKYFKILYRAVPKNYNFGIALRGIRVDEQTGEEGPIITLFKSYITNNLNEAFNKMINGQRIKATSGYYYYITQYQLFYEVGQGGSYKKISYDGIKGCSIFSPISKKSCGHYCLKYFNIDGPKGFLSLSDVKALSTVEVSDTVLDCDEYILLRDGHFVVVIKDAVIRRRKENKKIEKYENKKTKHLDELQNKKVCVYDIEAFGKMQTPIAIGYTFDGIDFNYYYGPTCVQEFIKNLDCDYLIGFNSNKYDNILLRNEILKNGYLIEDITRSENNIIKTIITKKCGLKIEFVDILNFTTGTLKKNLLNFKCKISKGEIDFDKLNFDMNDNDKELMIEYLKNDVLGTYELYKKLDEPFIAFNVSILELYTLSQGAYKIIKEQWKESGILQERQKRDVDAFFRKGIYGGRCEVFKRHFMSSEYKDIRMGKIKYDDITDYLLAADVNSLYPYMMRNNKYPIGGAILTTKEIEGKMAIYKCDIKKPKNLLYPILCSDGEFNLIDNQGVYTSFEIDEARKKGYIINVISGYYWNESEEIFKEYIDKFYEIKKNSPKTSPQYANSKLMMNAIYGKTIQRDKNIINYTVSDVEEMVEMKKGKDIKRFSGVFIDDIGYFEYEGELRLMTDKKPHIGAFILSYSKKVLNDVFESTDPYYTDTDSIYIHAKHSNKLKWGNELGEFSNDVNGKIICAYFIAKKLKFMEVLTCDNKIEFIYTGKGCDTRTMTKNNFKKMYQGLEVENITTLNFKRGVRTGTIEKRHNLKKTIKMNDGKRTFLNDGSSIPYGYKL